MNERDPDHRAPPAPTAPPKLAMDGHKGDAGRLLVAAGSADMPGACVLVARAAQRAGAGLVTVLSVAGELDGLLVGAAPEAVLLRLGAVDGRGALGVATSLGNRRDHARAVGPGLGTDVRARAIVDALVALAGPLVLDADGLNLHVGRIDRLRLAPGPLVLTPHPGEAARLLGHAVPQDRVGRAEAARELARLTHAVVVLKGAGTVVAESVGSEERMWVSPTGNPGMATAGAGDVLTGILGAYLCRVGPGFEAWDAARAAVWAHGRAGDLAAQALGRRAVIASDLVDHLPAAQRELDGE